MQAPAAQWPSRAIIALKPDYNNKAQVMGMFAMKVTVLVILTQASALDGTGSCLP